MAIERRKLTFASLDEVVADAENLLAKGYEKAGNWDLAQVCGHLAEWMRFPSTGSRSRRSCIRPMLWLMRVTVGKTMLREDPARTGFTPGGRDDARRRCRRPAATRRRRWRSCGRRSSGWQAHTGRRSTRRRCSAQMTQGRVRCSCNWSTPPTT